MLIWGGTDGFCYGYPNKTEKDADGYERYARAVMRQCKFIKPLLMRTAPDPTSFNPRDISELLYIGKRFYYLGEREMAETVRFWTMSIAEFLDQYIKSDIVKAHIAGSGIIGTGLGPYSPGTAYVLLHHYMGEVDGSIGAWGFSRGGMGSITKAMALSFQDAGGEIRTGSGLDQFIVKIRMHQDAHGRGHVIDAVEIALIEGAQVPQAGPNLFDRCPDVALVRAVCVRIVEPRARKPNQIFVIGARSATRGRA